MSFYEAKNYKIVNFWYILSRKYTQKWGQGKRGSKLPCTPKSVSQAGPNLTTDKSE